MSELKRERVIIGNVREIRKEDPGIGGYKLWVMLCALFGSGFMPGRDSFYTLLRRHHLMLPPRKVRHTTSSNHRYHKWKNLVKGLVPTAANQLWVADITYIELADGNACYLHLMTGLLAQDCWLGACRHAALRHHHAGLGTGHQPGRSFEGK